MEDFYRWQRRRLGYLMDGDEPGGGPLELRSRQPRAAAPMTLPSSPSRHARARRARRRRCWPHCRTTPAQRPVGLWATARGGGTGPPAPLRRPRAEPLRPVRGRHDRRSWHLAHSMLSPYLNLGPAPARRGLRRGRGRATGPARCPSTRPRASSARSSAGASTSGASTGSGPTRSEANELDHRPPAAAGVHRRGHDRACAASPTRSTGSSTRAWVHHIPRLMVLSNFANLYGIAPTAGDGLDAATATSTAPSG